MASSLQLNFIKKFSGYFNYRDITNLLPNALSVGSQNMFILDGVKIATRGGMDYLGIPGTEGSVTNASWTIPNRIHSHYETFENNQGMVMPFRIWYSGSTVQGDVVETWLPEYLAGIVQPTKKWYQVNANVPSHPILSNHKWYWGEWFDSVNNINRIVTGYGQQTVTSYTGAYAPIVSITGTTLQTVPGTTWQQFGFINAPEGVNSIVINVAGIPTEIPLASGDFSTDTVTLASTTGIAVNDLAFQAFNNDTVQVQSTDTNFVVDQPLSLGNQIYYFDWRQRNVLLSWEFDQFSFNTPPVYQGTSGQNDAIFSGTYTGTQTDTYQIYIDSIRVNIQTFYGNGINDAVYNTSAYSGANNVENIYKTFIVADSTIIVTTSSNTFTIGEVIVGGTSGAQGTYVGYAINGFNSELAMSMLFGTFQQDETIVGQGSGTTTTINAGTVGSPSVLAQNWIQASKNGTPILLTSGVVVGFIVPIFTAGAVQLIDNVTITFANYYNHTIGDTWELDITNPPADTFTWYLNGVLQASFIPCSLTPTLLSNGVSINFASVTGHNIGDNWVIVYYPTITRGWRQTYYTGYGNTSATTPATNKGSIRLPGEGFKMQLDSNASAACVQENVMYVNGAGGEYYTIQPQLSSNNQTQTYTVTRLKTSPQKKAIYPYQMVSEPNYLAIVTAEKTWDVLGRQKFIELPQLKSFSDFVKYDFLNANWLNSEQTYFDRKQWFILPEQNQVFCYDDFMKYWHPPQSFGRRIGSLCIIDGLVCAHSYERNETYQVFTTDMNDLGEFPINTDIELSYYDLNKRYNRKTVQAIGFDGYMKGAPKIKWTINGGVGGCDFQQIGTINPTYCLPKDTASLGKSQYGYHGLGNSPETIIPHFTYGETFGEQNYYLRNISLKCNSFEQLWSITSIAEFTKYDLATNSDIFNKDSTG